MPNIINFGVYVWSKSMLSVTQGKNCCIIKSMHHKPKSTFHHLKRGIQDFHINYVLVPADRAANNVVVV